MRLVGQLIGLFSFDVGFEIDLVAGPRARGRRTTGGDATPTRGAGAPGVRDAAATGAARHAGRHRRRRDRDRHGERARPRLRRGLDPAAVAARPRAATRCPRSPAPSRAPGRSRTRPALLLEQLYQRILPAIVKARPQPLRRGLLRAPGRPHRAADDDRGAAGAGAVPPRRRAALRGEPAVGRRDRRRLPHAALVLPGRPGRHRVERGAGRGRRRLRRCRERARVPERPAPRAALLRRRARPLHGRDVRARHDANARRCRCCTGRIAGR